MILFSEIAWEHQSSYQFVEIIQIININLDTHLSITLIFYKDRFPQTDLITLNLFKEEYE